MIVVFSYIVSFISLFRNFLYDNKIFSNKNISVPVISVGNIELGGTGKTPVVLYLSKLLLKNGFKPGIISRGYKRSSRGQQIVSDGLNIFLNHKTAGDEPFLIAKSILGIPIIVNKNRVSGANYIVKNFDVNVIILDDAFQHRKINRNIDIVLLNINTPPNKLKPFPLGRLRENFKAVFRSDILLVTKKNKNTPLDALNFYSSLYFHNLFFSSNTFSLINPISNDVINIKKLSKNIFAFCGIGDPNHFKNSLLSLDIDVSIFKSFADHQNYSDQILTNLEFLIANHNIKTIITTEKDYIKLPLNFCNSFSILVLKIDFIFDKSFDSLILKML